MRFVVVMRVAVRPADTRYATDDPGRRYRLFVGDEPSPALASKRVR